MTTSQPQITVQPKLSLPVEAAELLPVAIIEASSADGSQVEPAEVGIEIPELTLDAVEQLDDSVLAKSLQRFVKERHGNKTGDGASMHENTTHTDTHSSSMW